MRPLRREMQVVFQDPFSSLSPRLSVAQIVEEGLKVHRLAATVAERRHLIETALEEVGLDPEAAERYPHEFSGGQRQRIAIARPTDRVTTAPEQPYSRTLMAAAFDLAAVRV